MSQFLNVSHIFCNMIILKRINNSRSFQIKFLGPKVLCIQKCSATAPAKENKENTFLGL